MSDAQYPTGTYVKGDDAKVATTSARAVSLAFDGYRLAKTETKADPEKVIAPVTDDVDTNPNRRTRKPAAGTES